MAGEYSVVFRNRMETSLMTLVLRYHFDGNGRVIGLKYFWACVSLFKIPN